MGFYLIFFNLEVWLNIEKTNHRHVWNESNGKDGNDSFMCISYSCCSYRIPIHVCDQRIVFQRRIYVQSPR